MKTKLLLLHHLMIQKNDIEEIILGFEDVLTECWQFEVIKDLEQYIDKSETDDYADDIENNEGTE